jgi:hypothetical protein
VVAGQGAKLRRQLRAALVGELLRVQLDRQAERARGFENAPRLRRREADAIAEGVDRVDQPLGMQLRQPGTDSVDVVVGAAVELGRQRMRGQTGRADGQRQFGTEPARDAQHSRFVLQAQPVT